MTENPFNHELSEESTERLSEGQIPLVTACQEDQWPMDADNLIVGYVVSSRSPQLTSGMSVCKSEHLIIERRAIWVETALRGQSVDPTFTSCKMT
ncbi:hypothetical protein N7539_001861 [Penicillium diatomitis]|uniref:Uncharacterized protein n=1 Tax=Penicillium diatomitis TaxID=2819901 RepID=A0A9W9XIE9_9EURO|nr:uncharacterized protein N7539_001861 [Penicillium diatomitis]KAJ5493115.1 hypothetical protein N7539_001861 [Penicillium diatomitis]